MRNMYPHETARPFRTNRTGRPGGSGAQPPLHLIYMVKIGRCLASPFVPDHFAREG